MNDYAPKEIEIITLGRQAGRSYLQIQKDLEAQGFYRTPGAIKKTASIRGIRAGTAPQDTIVCSGPSDASDSFGAESTEVTVEFPQIAKKSKRSRVLSIGDFHAPFEHRYYLEFLLETYHENECDEVVLQGDEVDLHAISRYPSDPDGYSAGHELKEAIKHLQPYYKAFPNARVCTSNHTVRGFKKGFESGIPAAFFKSYKELLQAPDGWSWHSHIEIDDILYHHGEGYSGALGHHKAALNAMKSTVIGHIHSHGGVSYIQTEFKRIFGMNSGCGVDIEAYAFAYGKACAFKPTLGCGVVIEGEEAYFIPMRGY